MGVSTCVCVYVISSKGLTDGRGDLICIFAGCKSPGALETLLEGEKRYIMLRR